MADTNVPAQGRVRRHLQDAEDAAVAGIPTGASSVPANSGPSSTDKKTGIGFFNSKPATAAQKTAKQQGLIAKLRARKDPKQDFGNSGNSTFGKEEQEDD